MIKSTLARNTACNAIVRLVDTGSSYSTGQLTVLNSDSTVITRHTLSNPAFNDSTDGTAVANIIYDATAIRDGTAALFSVLNRDSSVIWSGTVTNTHGTGDLKLNTTIVPVDSTISISSAFFQVPA